MAKQVKAMETVVDSDKLLRLVENAESSKQTQAIPSVRKLIAFIRKELL